MANYPLKNIAIGNDVYEIQSGDKSYRVTLRAVLNDTSVSISSMSVKDILETYASSINWDIVGIFKIGPGGGSYDPAQTMLDDLIGMKYYQAEYEFRGGDTTKRGNFISWSPEDEQACQPMFGIDESNAISGLVSVVVDTEQNSVSNMKLSNFGGGGGGSVLEVTLCDQYSQPVPIGQFDSSSTLTNAKLMDGSTAKTFDDIFNAWKAGEVIINAGASYDASKRHFKVTAIAESNSTSIAAVYIQANSPRYVSFEYGGGAWNMTKN